MFYVTGIRTFLLESEEHECPDCNEKDVSPETLIPNRFLRNAVMNFKNETGYAKRQTYRPAPINQSVVQPEPPKIEIQQPTTQATGQVKCVQTSSVGNTLVEYVEPSANFESLPQQFPSTSAQPQTTTSEYSFSLLYVFMCC